VIERMRREEIEINRRRCEEIETSDDDSDNEDEPENVDESTSH